MTTSTFQRSKGIWKFNNSLLESPDYISLINIIIEEEKLKYAIPPYEINYLRNTYNKFEKIIDNLFLEALILRIRGETIKFATIEKRSLKKLKGQFVRSRLQWLQYGERPSIYLTSPENKNYIEKIIKRVKLCNGNYITDQKGILDQNHQYYSNVFATKDNILQNIDCDTLGIKQDTKISEDIGQPVTVEEACLILKRIKSNKSPGIDGITAEFLKVFWRRLKHFVIDAINCGFHKGCLTVSLRQCIITCLPKSNKDRTLLKLAAHIPAECNL